MAQHDPGNNTGRAIRGLRAAKNKELNVPPPRSRDQDNISAALKNQRLGRIGRVNKAELRNSVGRQGTMPAQEKSQTPVEKGKIIANAFTNCRVSLTQISNAEKMLQQQQELGKPNSLDAALARSQMDQLVKKLKSLEPTVRGAGKKGFAAAEAINGLCKAVEERNQSSASNQLGGGTLDFNVRKELLSASRSLNAIK